MNFGLAYQNCFSLPSQGCRYAKLTCQYSSSDEWRGQNKNPLIKCTGRKMKLQMHRANYFMKYLCGLVLEMCFPLWSVSVGLMFACFSPAGLFPCIQLDCCSALGQRVAPHPAFAKDPSRQWPGTRFLNTFVLLFPFWKRPMSKESIWLMAQMEVQNTWLFRSSKM